MRYHAGMDALTLASLVFILSSFCAMSTVFIAQQRGLPVLGWAIAGALFVGLVVLLCMPAPASPPTHYRRRRRAR